MVKSVQEDEVLESETEDQYEAHKKSNNDRKGYK
jgi:hypothetical protein